MRKILTGILLLLGGAMAAAAWVPGGGNSAVLRGLLNAELPVAVVVGLMLLWAEYQKEKQERVLSELREQEWKEQIGLRRHLAEERLAKESGELQQILNDRLTGARKELNGRQTGPAERPPEKTARPDDSWDRRCCANSIVDIVMKEKQKEYADRKITFILSLSVPSRTKISAWELCSIFTNLIDNAAAACMELPEKQRRIAVQAGVNGSYLYIRVQNPTLVSHAARPARPGHGLGTGIIREIAEKNGGEYRAGLIGDEYRADVAVEI